MSDDPEYYTDDQISRINKCSTFLTGAFQNVVILAQSDGKDQVIVYHGNPYAISKMISTAADDHYCVAEMSDETDSDIDPEDGGANDDLKELFD